jgi:hypothetical protein
VAREKTASATSTPSASAATSTSPAPPLPSPRTQPLQTRTTIDTMKATLPEARATIEYVVRVRNYVTNIEDV